MNTIDSARVPSALKSSHLEKIQIDFGSIYLNVDDRFLLLVLNYFSKIVEDIQTWTVNKYSLTESTRKVTSLGIDVAFLSLLNSISTPRVHLGHLGIGPLNMT